MSQCQKRTKDGVYPCSGEEGHQGGCFLHGVMHADFDRSADEKTDMRLAMLQELLATYTPGKGWDKASIRLGYARGRGLSLEEAQRFANET
jgi:hypothetical protein